MKRFRLPIILLIVVLVGVTGAFAFREWRVKAAARRKEMALAEAQALIKSNKPKEALALADTYANDSEDPAWLRVQLQAVTKLEMLPRLGRLFERFPEVVLKDEDASVVLAHGYLQANMPAMLERVRAAWRGHERHPESWRMLDADTYLLMGDRRKAEKLLTGNPTQGDMEAQRLIRLALVTAERDPVEACKLLDQAVAMQPTNSVARWSRGEVLERMGRMRMARVEYVSALTASPGNLYWRDQLAEFYLRSHNHDLAVATWQETPVKPFPDFIQLKLQFFNRVLRPDQTNSPVATAPGELEPLVRLIEGLKPGRFFDAEAFKRLPFAGSYAAQRPEVFWLRLLDLLQTGGESAALDMFTTEAPRLQSWDPDLAGAVARVLYYRKKQSLNPPGIAFRSMWAETNRPPFFALIERAARDEQAAPDHKAKLSPDFSSLLRGSNIFSHLFMTAGWREAALQLRHSPHVEPGEPDALTAAYAEALSLNRNAGAALDFLGNGALPLATTLVRAELLLEVGRKDDARGQLRGMAKHNSPTGVRAASLLALDAIERKDYAGARQCIADQPLLAQSNLGKEMLARMALAENRPADAEALYHSIESTSIEAKSWLARKAFAEKRWKDARRIVNESLELIPDSPELQSTLAAIDRAEAAPKAP